MDLEYDLYPVSDNPDSELLMHRNAHFGGKFDIMLDYYSQDGIGVQPDISLDRIEELFRIENEMGEDLAETLLSDTEMAKVEAARQSYEKLREVYEINKPKTPIPKLIANLIFTEDEFPEEEIEAICEHGERAIPLLHDLITSDEFYDPLFPGYGFAPIHAAACLARIGCDKSIHILFERIGSGDFLNEESVIDALTAFGEPAQKFLNEILQSRPIRPDTENAIIALLEFEERASTAKIALELLQDPAIKGHDSLMNYLVFACDQLEDESDQRAFKELKQLSHIPQELYQDIDLIAEAWL